MYYITSCQYLYIATTFNFNDHPSTESIYFEIHRELGIIRVSDWVPTGGSGDRSVNL